VSADGGGTQFVFPPGKTPDQLYQTLVVLISTLNRIKTADATDLTAVNQALTDAQQEISDLWEVVDAGGVGLTPQQAWELSLVTAVDTMLGSVSNLVRDTIRRSNEAAEAAIKATLAGLQNKGEIRVEQVVRKSEREVFVGQLSSFEAALNNTQAAVNNEIIARANGDSALSSDITDLTTTVNGNTAQIIILANSIDGIEARWGVAVNLQGQVVGLVQLDGTASGSTFTVVADKFQVAQPDAAGGTPVPVFTIANVGGTNKLVLRGDMLADGTITATKLSVSTLSAITANLGTITAGLIKDLPTSETVRFDVPNMRWYRTDGKAEIDLKNRRILFLGN
jgi:hypothetical protein